MGKLKTTPLLTQIPLKEFSSLEVGEGEGRTATGFPCFYLIFWFISSTDQFHHKG